MLHERSSFWLIPSIDVVHIGSSVWQMSPPCCRNTGAPICKQYHTTDATFKNLVLHPTTEQKYVCSAAFREMNFYTLTKSMSMF